jgi:hypothetical protein
LCMIVSMSVYNRPGVTECCLRQLAETKPDCVTLQAWDAGSTEMTPSDLSRWGADEVYVTGKRVNDGQNRTGQFEHFLRSTNEDLLYCVDNDALHDSRWYDRLMELYDTHACIINLFNSRDHATLTKTPFHQLQRGSTIAETDDVVFRKTCGGISFMINRQTLKHGFRGPLTTSYDWIVPTWDRHVCTSRQSYVAHLDQGGMHTHMHKLRVDPGLNPTDGLMKLCHNLTLA